MKTDIERLMAKSGVDALLITGSGQHNPGMVYLTGGAYLNSADLIVKPGAEPSLFHYPMERDEAAKTGLKTIDLTDIGLDEIRRIGGGDPIRTEVEKYQRIFKHAGLEAGRVAVAGMRDAGTAYAVFSELREQFPEISFDGKEAGEILLKAMSTKDHDEIDRIRRMGMITVDVVHKTADFLTTREVRDGALLNEDGAFLTIGDVKNQIRLWVAENGAELPEGFIFAQGGDAGVPHSTGDLEDVLRLGETIVFDIFPCEAGGGYYFDFTRTWCLGYASKEAQRLYADVFSVYQTVTGELQMGEYCRLYQERVCELFEQQGHSTIRSVPGTKDGYVHSLGHGLGLHVHEYPWFSAVSTNKHKLLPGSVVTIEPGLYYPERGMGVRLEDTVWIRPDGEIEVLVDYPMDFVLPVKGYNFGE
ncbi:MAG: M24 family metallopeptidase [Anaerolineales bacterium]|jgi:Xaa-Pro aminopeptidase